MEKYFNRLKYGTNSSDDGVHPTDDKMWDLTRKYLHTGILEVAQQNYKEDHPEIQLFIDIILQAGKDYIIVMMKLDWMQKDTLVQRCLRMTVLCWD